MSDEKNIKQKSSIEEHMVLFEQALRTLFDSIPKWLLAYLLLLLVIIFLEQPVANFIKYMKTEPEPPIPYSIREAKKIRAEANTWETYKLLLPFTDKGFRDPFTNRICEKKVSASWSYIKKFCLGDSDRCICNLVELACYPDKERMREYWVDMKPVYEKKVFGVQVHEYIIENLSEENLAKIKEIQSLLSRVGPTLVERERLEP